MDSRFLKKSPHRYQRPFISLWLWMRSVKNSPDTIENHSYARAPTCWTPLNQSTDPIPRRRMCRKDVPRKSIV